jgi:hypothetical protein
MTKEINSKDSSELCEHVWNIFELFCEKQYVDKNNFFLSPIHTKAAIDNALMDLERLKDFHMPIDGKLPDRHKIAGFIARWVAKVKPIQITSECAFGFRNTDVEQLLKLNSSFAVHVFSSLLKEEMPNNMAKYLRYWFEFRDERGETLAFVAYCCEEMAKKVNTLQQ